MSNAAQKYLPDTNILLHHVRRSRLDQWIKANYPLAPTDPAVTLSIVIVGEIRSLAKQFDWGDAKIRSTEDFVASCVVTPLEYEGLIDAYVDIDNYSISVGWRMGENDLWIAATASVTGATLLTTDKDFDHLHPIFLQRIYIDPAMA
jgi:tRNA(fMet)-specific endonuclease VapC